MYNEPAAGAVCVIAADVPIYHADLKVKYPGELHIDRMIHHKGEVHPSYRISNVPPDEVGRAVWINGLYLDFVRHQWTAPASA